MKRALIGVGLFLFSSTALGDAAVRAALSAGPDPKVVNALVMQLNDKRFPVRARADRRLRRFGIAVVPLLHARALLRYGIYLLPEMRREASLASDPEEKRRLEKVIETVARR